MFEGKKQKLREERETQRTIEQKRKNYSAFSKGVDEEKGKSNDDILKGKTKENEEGEEQEVRRILKEGLLGKEEREKPLKLQRMGLLWLFQIKKNHENKKKQKT